MSTPRPTQQSQHSRKRRREHDNMVIDGDHDDVVTTERVVTPAAQGTKTRHIRVPVQPPSDDAEGQRPSCTQTPHRPEPTIPPEAYEPGPDNVQDPPPGSNKVCKISSLWQKYS